MANLGTGLHMNTTAYRYVGGPLVDDCRVCGRTIHVRWTDDSWSHGTYADDQDHPATPFAHGDIEAPEVQRPKWLTLRCPTCQKRQDVLPGGQAWCDGQGRHKSVRMVAA